ncbi:MAG: DUF3794 domain-containing protein [Clostridia bacterium]|nr:DUF3794 domain-containing protein [Clostridia bacterium]
MDFKPEKKKLTLSQLFMSLTSQQNVTAEISLPDYCSDIKRILKCIITPSVTSVSSMGENITANVTADIRLIYVGEKDKIDCYETQKELAFTSKCKALPAEAIISPKAKTNYVNCRATSQRRISVEGNVAVSFDIFTAAEKEVLTSCSGKGVETKKEIISYERLICQREKVFDMGETLQVPSDKGAVGKIIRTGAYAVLDSKKAVSDKLLIKGQLCTQVLYCVEGEEGRVSLLNHSMPISQIIDLPGIDENTSCSVRLNVRCLSVQRKSDSASNGSLLEIGAKVAAFCKCTAKEQVCTVEDCYSTSHEIETEYALEEFLSPIESVNRQKTVKHTLDFSSLDIANITDIWCSDALCSMKGRGDTAKGECSLTVSMLYLDSKGVPGYGEKNVDFNFETKLPEKSEQLLCNMHCQVRSVDSTLTAKDKVEVKIENGIFAEIYSCLNKKILRSIEVKAEKENKDTAPLTVYFPSKGEKLWDIARRYSTTAEEIRKENSIEGDTAESEDMLLIPAG